MSFLLFTTNNLPAFYQLYGYTHDIIAYVHDIIYPYTHLPEYHPPIYSTHPPICTGPFASVYWCIVQDIEILQHYVIFIISIDILKIVIDINLKG